MSSRIALAVTNLDHIHRHSGIGRVVCELTRLWHRQVTVQPAYFKTLPFPVLRNFPIGVAAPPETTAILLPQLTGASALQYRPRWPAVVIVHDIGFIDCPQDRGTLGHISYRAIWQSFKSLRHASRIVAISHFTKQRLLAKLPALWPDDIRVIPLGVNELFHHYHATPHQARTILVQHLGGPLGTPLVIYVGNEGPRKNLDLLLQVVRALKIRHPGLQLLKIGRAGRPSWRLKTLEQIAELGLRLPHDVRILEDLEDPWLAHAYRASDVFVSASLYEGFGLPAIEALAIGTPVVVTNRGAFPEVVGTRGYLVAPQVEVMVRAIQHLITKRRHALNPLRPSVKVPTTNWSQVAHQYLDLVDDMQRDNLRAHGAGPPP